VATAIRGGAGALKDLEDRQKSRATRLKRDSLDLALLDLAGFYRDVLAIQFGADVELANAAQRDELGRIAAAGTPEATVRKIEAIMACRVRLAASVAPLLAVEEMTIALAAASHARPADGYLAGEAWWPLVTCPGGATGGEGSVLKCPEHAPDGCAS
jgi:DNA polymerase-3 subunit delta'